MIPENDRPGPNGAGDQSARELSLADLELAVSAVVRWSESKHIRSEVARRSGCDLASSELRLLEHFDACEPMRVSDVAECMQVDVSTASLQLRVLRREKLVEAVRDTRDRRVTLIAITGEGRATVARVRAVRSALLNEIFAGVAHADLEHAANILLLVHEQMLAGARAVSGSADRER